jgi:hypothetical protein
MRGSVTHGGHERHGKPVVFKQKATGTMNTTEPTARDQFARDCMLVLENDRRAYEHIMKKAKRLNANNIYSDSANTYALAEFLREYVENVIGFAVDPKHRETQTVGALLIAQICTGYGIDPFYDMARDFMTAAAESAGV